MNLTAFFRILTQPIRKLSQYLTYRKAIHQGGGYLDYRVQFKIAGTFTYDHPIFLAVNGIDVPSKSLIWVQPGASLHIGANSGMTAGSIVCTQKITIGKHVNIGANTLIMDSNFHSLYWQDRSNRKLDVTKAQSAPIVIEDYVFIGARCIIHKGVTIGEKSIVAAGSVVVKDIPPHEIWGGNPAHFIRKVTL